MPARKSSVHFLQYNMKTIKEVMVFEPMQRKAIKLESSCEERAAGNDSYQIEPKKSQKSNC